jgi:2-methylcitrate dehydratase PrpD
VKHRYARDGIAAFVHGMSYGRIPQDARHAAKRLLLDSLACIAGGWSEPSARIARTVAEELGGPAEAHLLLTRRKTSAFNATLANGVALRALDLIDMYHSLDHAHPCEMTIPPALAVGQRMKSSGKDMLTATVIGYELCMKFAEITGNTRKGWAGTATLGQFVTPLVAGYLLRLTRRQLAEAFSISGAHNVSLAVTYNLPVSMTKDALNTFAAQSGVMAALLAKRGFTGPAGILEAPGGLWPQLESDATLAAVLDGLGSPFRIVKCGLKDHRYAAIAWSHPAVEALLTLRERHGLTPRNVKAIRVRTTRKVATRIAGDAVRSNFTPLDAQFNGPCILATALKFGDLLPKRQRMSADTDVRKVSRLVRIEHDPSLDPYYPEKLATIVDVTTASGETHTCRVDYRRGDPANPLSDADIEEKFEALSARHLPKARARRIIDMVWSLEKQKDINRLAESFLKA